MTYNLLRPVMYRMGSAVNASPTTTLGMVLSFLLAGLYFVAFWTLIGRTPGMLLLGMKIVTGDGRRSGFVGSLIRYIGDFVSATCLCLGSTWIGIDARKQGWHDKLAGTFVACNCSVSERRKHSGQDRRTMSMQLRRSICPGLT